MNLKAIIREVSPNINDCELSFHARQPIDLRRAIAQHHAYQQCLADLGAEIVSLPAEPELPDSVFVEDTAVVLDEIAIIAQMGAASRRAETKSVAAALAPYRLLSFMTTPATLDGGDVLRVNRTLFVGLSQRTNRDGLGQLEEFVRPHGYEVRPIEMQGCLHLKSACSFPGQDSLLVNRACLDLKPLRGFTLIDVPEEEPDAANVLLLNDVVLMPAAFPRTAVMLERRGFRVRAVDVSELQKAEAGVTCCSLIFST